MFKTIQLARKFAYKELLQLVKAGNTKSVFLINRNDMNIGYVGFDTTLDIPLNKFYYVAFSGKDDETRYSLNPNGTISKRLSRR